MRVFVAVLVLIFSLQSWTKADDVSDFEIEGMSVGDSLLDFFSEEEIEKLMKSELAYIYPDKKFIKIMITIKKNSVYDDLGVILKYDNKDYIMHEISGRVYCDEIKICLNNQKEALSVLKNIFKDNAKLEENIQSHYIDPTGNSIVYIGEFYFKNTNAGAAASVYDWSDKLTKENQWFDCLQVDVSSHEYNTYVQKISK